MKKIYYLFSVAFAWFSTSMLYAQEKTADVLARFSSEAPVHWAISTNEGRLDLEWRPRQNSLSQEGFRSFVAYHEGVFSGSISLSSNTFSGEIWHEGHTYFLTDEKGLLRVSPSRGATSCATCQEGDCDIRPSSQVLSRGTILAEESLPSEDKRVLYNVHVLRTFRLAMLIDYSFYKGHCQGSMELAKAFMVDVQTKLNEVCGRELGYQFELVDDARLIRDTEKKEVYPDKPLVRTVVNTATDTFNKLIGEENYDAGIVFSVYKDNRGLAHLGEITGKLKGGCVANQEFYIILHELGHLLGSAHTFTIGGATASSFTEPDRGNSIMSYINDPYGTYFSLPSIYTIHNRTNLHDAYYADKARTQLVGLPQPNIPYGEPSDNKAPMIDRSKLKKSYALPPNTYFQFTIEASDPDGDPLLYMAHQADFKEFGKARFPSNRPTTDNKIAFYRPYTKDNNTNEWKEVPYKFTEEYETGDFTFWLGVCDGSVGAYKAGKPHTPLYDVYQTKVQIKDGTPFRITNIVRSSRSGAYKRGEDVTLHWSVDKKLFAPDSKVRILFSDNYGKTYDYVLAEGVPNNGEATVTFPQAKGWKGYAGYVEGLFKIEVLDHIAYAVDLDKLYMKDMVKSDIIFNNLPKPVITVKRTEIPERAEVTARSVYCNDKNTMVSFSEETYPDYILRRWVAIDKCKNKATFVQYIYFEKETPTRTLHFVGDLPQDIHVQCRGEIPPKATLQAEGSDSVEIEYEEEMTEGDKKAYKLTRVWTAYAADAPAIRHVQQIFLKDTQRPEFSAYPANLTVKDESEIPFKPTLTATDNCDSRVDVSSSSEPIYDKQGKKIGERNIWFAEDNAHNENRYEQIITINPQKSNNPQPISFVAHTLPQSITVDCSGKVPSVQLPLTSGGCSTPQVTYQDRIKVQHAPNDYEIERTYKAKDNCGEVTHLQLITVKDDKAPVWLGQLPQPKEILQGDPIPEGAPLAAQDNCEGILTATPTKEETSDHITYQWVVSDSNGNKATHTQVITIKPKKDIPAPTPEPKPAPAFMPELNNKGIAVYNGISTESGSQNYFKIENTDDNTPIEVVIFNEMGLKVYESTHYQQGSDVFRGYANVRGVVGSGQRLPTGTYFYVIHYYQQGVSYMKKGYLYVR
ncbi:reprolysin-like metallopeptidase [Capnocytophaga gingivalis]|uniref:reprolysin-like metallopeptidase n=1 Tax=Capnocytophaga gingivalis TaxID=1017 RepID=UPI00067FEDB7|nr:M12 family metallo-peptidase [Capnocytophaga gingivalis]